MMLLYSALLTLSVAVSAPVWGWRMLRQGRYREGLRQRLGAVPARLRAAVQGRPVVWLHAVSVGEVMASTRLVRELETALPGYSIVISTTTPTGQRVARERFGVDRVFYFPLDFAFAVRAYLQALQPHLLVLMESELWPRMVMECDGAGVPVAVVNARVSDRSLPRYRTLRMLWRPLLRRLSMLLAQSSDDAQRWKSIGAPMERVRVSGNLKFDVAVVNDTPLVRMLRQHLSADVPVLVCGSTHPGEESQLLNCLAQRRDVACVTVLAPRHPERAGEVELLAQDRGFAVVRLSTWRTAACAVGSGSVLLVDTVGELAALYALATVAFVGGSLVPRGGQNPLEPAAFGVPVVMGPHFENFRTVVGALQAAGSVALASVDTLCATLFRHLQEEPDVHQRERSRAVFQAEAGATQRTVSALIMLLPEAR